jgi:hypothetical protein
MALKFFGDGIVYPFGLRAAFGCFAQALVCRIVQGCLNGVPLAKVRGYWLSA